MSKKDEIKKYLHHFLGCDVMILRSGGSPIACGETKLTAQCLRDYEKYELMILYPILNESKQNVLLKEDEKEGLYCDVESFRYLCSQGYDIFGLGEKGLCMYPQKDVVNIYTQKGLWEFSDLSSKDKHSIIEYWVKNKSDMEISVINDVYMLDIKSSPQFFAWLGALIIYEK